jgi:hypothetical protein
MNKGKRINKIEPLVHAIPAVKLYSKLNKCVNEYFAKCVKKRKLTGTATACAPQLLHCNTNIIMPLVRAIRNKLYEK